MKTSLKHLFRAPAAALLVTAALGLSVPAASFAADRDVLTARVKVSDLNLSTASGQRQLARRTSSAIEQVCPARGSAAGPRSSSRNAYRACEQEVRNSVKTQVEALRARPMARG
jgi:UrcA family protein